MASSEGLCNGVLLCRHGDRGSELLQLFHVRDGHRNPAPVLGRGNQARVEQRQTRTFGRKSRDDLCPPPGFAVEPLESIRRPNALVMRFGEPQVRHALLEVPLQALHRRGIAVFELRDEVAPALDGRSIRRRAEHLLDEPLILDCINRGGLATMFRIL